ncbi:MAG TPA: deoxynucleoside kinase [Deltaproteobacteria bacterium]|nr:deoxynucleoside kinase [Candidatus Binatota bacterium]HIL12821.1 deoxynucleoside kinase [Deltaproteobacteria bacterium]
MRYIAVEGPIAVGKSSLAQALAQNYGARLVREPLEDNPFLARFYEEPQRYAFTAQLSFLIERYRQQQELVQMDLFQQATVADYLFAKDRIFAEITLSEDELVLYDRIYGLLDARVRQPDLVVFLDADIDVLLRRLRKRARSFEKRLGREYLEKLAEAYRRFFHGYRDAPLLVVNSSDIDFVENGGDFTDLVREIDGMGQGVQHYVPLGSN